MSLIPGPSILDDENSSILSILNVEQHRALLRMDEDWTGISNSKRRRILQNRLNQRASRKRRRDRDQPESDSKTPSQKTLKESIPNELRKRSYSKPERQAMIEQFIQQAHQEYLSKTPRPSSLHLLVQINVQRAVRHNAALLGFADVPDTCGFDAVSQFNRLGPEINSKLDLPTHLSPTRAQIAIEHHPWIDWWPIPKMRDNMLLYLDDDGEDALCRDICEVQISDEEKASLIVWGDPSDPMSWEASLLFLKKWGFLLQGCHEVLEATNYWRAKRGERLLVFNATAGG